MINSSDVSVSKVPSKVEVFRLIRLIRSKCSVRSAFESVSIDKELQLDCEY